MQSTSKRAMSRCKLTAESNFASLCFDVIFQSYEKNGRKHKFNNKEWKAHVWTEMDVGTSMLKRLNQQRNSYAHRVRDVVGK